MAKAKKRPVRGQKPLKLEDTRPKIGAKPLFNDSKTGLSYRIRRKKAVVPPDLHYQAGTELAHKFVRTAARMLKNAPANAQYLVNQFAASILAWERYRMHCRYSVAEPNAPEIEQRRQDDQTAFLTLKRNIEGRPEILRETILAKLFASYEKARTNGRIQKMVEVRETDPTQLTLLPLPA
jgi:hypothetical protein